LPRLAHVTAVPDETVPIARIEGEIDISNASDLRDALEQLVSNAARGLVVDLSRVSYIDSAAVHLLLRLAAQLQKRRQELHAVAPADEAVRHVLVLTAVERLVPLHGTEEAAMAALRPPGRPA
jgi:anti-sigma B factor antagonist